MEGTGGSEGGESEARAGVRGLRTSCTDAPGPAPRTWPKRRLVSTLLLRERRLRSWVGAATDV